MHDMKIYAKTPRILHHDPAPPVPCVRHPFKEDHPQKPLQYREPRFSAEEHQNWDLDLAKSRW